MKTPQQEASETGNGATAGRIIVSDIEELAHSVDPWQLRMNQISPGKLRATFTVVPLLGMLLTRERWSHRVAASGATPPGYAAFAAPCGSQGFTWCGSRMEPHRLAYSPDSKETDFVTGQWDEHWTMLIPVTMLNDYLGEQLAADLMVDSRSIQGDPQLIAQLTSKVLSTIALLQGSSGYRADQSEQHLLKTQLLLAASGVLLGCDSGRFDKVDATRRFQAYRAARSAIEADATNIKIEELAKELGVSRRSLEVGFAQSMAISPKLFARYVRLNSLHRKLLHASPRKLSVTEAETRLNFSEFGRTAGYYRELFGELPSETLDRQPAGDIMRLSDSLVFNKLARKDQ